MSILNDIPTQLLILIAMLAVLTLAAKLADYAGVRAKVERWAMEKEIWR